MQIRNLSALIDYEPGDDDLPAPKKLPHYYRVVWPQKRGRSLKGLQAGGYDSRELDLRETPI